MIVYKFGGASVRDAGGIRNLAKIVSDEKEKLVVVVSAFGKTTNALEKVLKTWMAGDGNYKDLLDNIYRYHLSVAEELFPSQNSVRSKIDVSFSLLGEYLKTQRKQEYDYDYDQIVSYGEIWSTIIVAAFLQKSGLNAEWTDIRANLITDDRFRDADILWNESTQGSKAFSVSGQPVFMSHRDLSAVPSQARPQPWEGKARIIPPLSLQIYLMRTG
jgi:aspartate kinase